MRDHGRAMRRTAVALFASIVVATSACSAQAHPESATRLLPGTYAFIVNARTNDVRVVDAGTLAPIASNPISVGTAPSDIVLSPDGGRAYVVSPSDNDVSVIDTRSLTVLVDPIRVGTYPSGQVLSPDGTRLYVAGGETDDVRTFDTRTYRPVGHPIRIGDAPGGLAISRDGKWIYAVSQYQDDVRVIDTRTLAVFANPIAVGKRPNQVAVSSDGRRVYVANTGSDNVSVIDTATRTVIAPPIPVGHYPYGLVVSRDGQRVFVADQNSDAVSVIDTGAMKVVQTVPTGDAPTTIATSPDGYRIYVTNMYADTVTVINTETLNVIATSARIGQAPRGIAVAGAPNVNPPGGSFAPVSIIRNGNDIALSGELPDDTKKRSLLDAVRVAFGPGIDVTDDLKINSGVSAPDISQLGSLFTAARDVPDFKFDLNGDTLTLTGIAPSGEVKAAIGTAASALRPNLKITNSIQVRAARPPAARVGPPPARAPAHGGPCASLQADITDLLSTPITFDTNGFSLAPGSEQQLAQVADTLAACPNASVSVVGNTDDTGDEAINLPLSYSRARSVADYLISQGVPSDHVTARGVGSTDPIASNDTPDGRAQNRRVDIIVG